MIDIEALSKKIKALEKRNEAEINEIISKEVFANAKYKVGDIVEGRSYSVEVTRIKWSRGSYFSSGFKPQAVYFGYVLTKKLARRKDLDTASVYEEDINADF